MSPAKSLPTPTSPLATHAISAAPPSVARYFATSLLRSSVLPKDRDPLFSMPYTLFLIHNFPHPLYFLNAAHSLPKTPGGGVSTFLRNSPGLVTPLESALPQTPTLPYATPIESTPFSGVLHLCAKCALITPAYTTLTKRTTGASYLTTNVTDFYLITYANSSAGWAYHFAPNLQSRRYRLTFLPPCLLAPVIPTLAPLAHPFCIGGANFPSVRYYSRNFCAQRRRTARQIRAPFRLVLSVARRALSCTRPRQSHWRTHRLQRRLRFPRRRRLLLPGGYRSAQRPQTGPLFRSLRRHGGSRSRRSASTRQAPLVGLSPRRRQHSPKIGPPRIGSPESRLPPLRRKSLYLQRRSRRRGPQLVRGHRRQRGLRAARHFPASHRPHPPRPALPARGKRICWRPRRHHGSLRLLPRPCRTRPPARLPLAGISSRAASPGRATGHLQYNGQAPARHQRIQHPPRRMRRGRAAPLHRAFRYRRSARRHPRATRTAPRAAARRHLPPLPPHPHGKRPRSRRRRRPRSGKNQRTRAPHGRIAPQHA